MYLSTKVTSKGQITLPAEMRAKLDIQAGDSISFFTSLDGSMRFVVRRRRTGASFPMFKWDGPTIPIEAMDPGLPDEEVEALIEKANKAS